MTRHAIAMFEQRDRARGVKHDGPDLDLAAITHLLGDLALWLVRNEQLDADQCTAERVLVKSSRALFLGPHDGPALYRRLLVRSGLLREPSCGKVDFIHRTFQEYLAARALVSAENIGEIIKNADDDQWREIVILAAGLGNINQTTELLRGLLRPAFRDRDRYRRRMLAVASLREIRAVHPTVRKAVEGSIAALLPPRTMDQAAALSQAGEVILPLLLQVTAEDAEQAAAIVRASALVGGDQALAVIARTAKQYGMDIVNELTRSWNYFNADVYAKQVLDIAPIDRLLLSDANEDIIRALPYLGYLATLRLRLGAEDTDLRPLGFCRSLQILYLLSGRSSRLALPSSLYALRKLRIDGWCTLDDITDFTRLTAPNMRALEIRNCPRLTDLRPVASLSGLRELIVENIPNADLACLKDVPNLRRVTIGPGCGRVNVGILPNLGVWIEGPAEHRVSS